MVDFGVGMGANGQIQPVMIFTSTGSSSPPAEYASYFETAEGVRISMTVHSDNKALADTVEQDVAKAMGWKINEAAPAKPMSLAGELATGWAMGFIIVVVMGFVVFLGTIALESAGKIDFSTQEDFINRIPLYCLYAFPVISLLLNLVALLGKPAE